jgi:hypothetical protein
VPERADASPYDRTTTRVPERSSASLMKRPEAKASPRSAEAVGTVAVIAAARGLRVAALESSPLPVCTIDTVAAPESVAPCDRANASTPSPIASTATSDATPITMPRVESTVRSGLARSV